MSLLLWIGHGGWKGRNKKVSSEGREGLSAIARVFFAGCAQACQSIVMQPCPARSRHRVDAAAQDADQLIHFGMCDHQWG